MLRRSVLCFVAVLLMFCVVPVGAYTVAVCTDGLGVASKDGVYEFDSSGTLLAKTYHSFAPNSRRWQNLEYKDGLVYATSIEVGHTYYWNTSDGSWAGYWAAGSNVYEPVGSVFSPDGSYYYVLSSSSSKGVARYNAATGTFIDKFITTETTGAGIGIDPNGDLYITGQDGWTRKYSGTTGAKIGDSGGSLDPWTKEPTWHDGDIFVAQAGRIVRYDGTTFAGKGEFVVSGSIPDGANSIGAFAWTPDGDLLVAASNSGYATNKVYRFNGTTGAYIDEFCTLSARPTGIAFVPEPATMGLVLLGMPMIVRLRRK